MTQEQIEKSIAILLVKSIQNGWNSKRFNTGLDSLIAEISSDLERNGKSDFFDSIEREDVWLTYNSLNNTFTIDWQFYSNRKVTISLDDIISHHEEGEVSFVEALCKELYKVNPEYYDNLFAGRNSGVYDFGELYSTTYDEYVSSCIRELWVFKFTSERLIQFLGTFKYLLN